MAQTRPLGGVVVAITRPAGSGNAFARRVRALGGKPLSLPGSSLRAAQDADAARAALRDALACDAVIFTSPAAVRFARSLMPLRHRTGILAPGVGTARALRRAGVGEVISPHREDSEGLLALPALHAGVRGKRIGIVGAAGGRGLLDRELVARGARVVLAHVYRRLPARLDRRHSEALLHNARKPLYVPLSSAQALSSILAGLPDAARRVLLAGTAIASSKRLANSARQAGFTRVLQAGSAHAVDLLAAIVADKKDVA